MKLFLHFSVILSVLCAVTAAEDKSPRFEMSEKSIPTLKLTPGCQQLGGRLLIDNQSAGVFIPGSEQWHLGENGFTVAATIRLKRRSPNFGSGYGSDGKFLYDHDVIASKEGEFVFGRRSDRWCDQLYFNFIRGSEWSVPLISTVAIPPYDIYAHVAITVQRTVVDFRGLDGYIVTYYINGEPEKEQTVNCAGAVTPTSAPWRLGGGYGVRNDSWSFGGEMTDVLLFNRALNEAEIMALAVNSKPAKIAKMAGVAIVPDLEQRLASLQMNASEYGKWALEILIRSARNGADQQQMLNDLKKLAPALSCTDAKGFATRWNNAGAVQRILFQERSMLMVTTGKQAAGYPISGWYDLKRGAELFGTVPPGWELSSHDKNKQPHKQNSAGTGYTLTVQENRDQGFGGKITWLTPGCLEAESNFTFRDKRLEMDLKMKSLSNDLLLDEVTFPCCRFKRLRRGTDRLLYPKMSGVVFEKPISVEVPQPWKEYPNGELNMQFHAYYDDMGGIYFGMEDPYAGTKRFVTRGRDGDLQMQWTHPVAFDANATGGGDFVLSGKSAMEIFDGDWFDAGRIYRSFLTDQAEWWIPTLPRMDTPQWMRENTLWILQLCFNEWDWYNTITNLKELREYFELPFGIHYYEWFDLTRGENPHYYAKTSALQVVNELNDADIYVKPYIDNRSWRRQDGLAPGKDHKDGMGFYKADGGSYDFQFSRVAEKMAVRSCEGELTLENNCAVMCPASREWQQYIFNTVKRLAGQGFRAIYHDEVTTAQPRACFNTNHGHPMNSPRNWLENGYWKMLNQLAVLREKYPELCHDSEDASEPYMKYLDGVCPIRWVDPGQVPLFASIYSGRTQFNGRIYDHHTRGDEESFYDKMVVQLINSEQLGWFTADYLNDPSKRLFTKRLMHLRRMLLSYFNEGEMEHPLKFKGEVPTRTMIWGCLGRYKISNPKIQHCVFRRPDGLTMFLFVNASPDEVTVEPVFPAKYGKYVRCSGQNAKFEFISTSGHQVTLNGREVEVYIAGQDANLLSHESARIQKELVRIAHFAPGRLRYDLMSHPQPISEPDGLYYSFDDIPVWHTQPAYLGLGCYELIGHPRRQLHTYFNLLLEPQTTYELSVAIRKDRDTNSLLRVCNYDKENRPSSYAVIGETIPADGIWHYETVRFSTDSKAHRSGLYLYIEPTTQTLRIDELRIKKVK